MKLKCVNTEGVMPGLLEVGKVYDILERWKGVYMVNDFSVNLSNFETPLDILEDMIRQGGKVLLTKPSGQTVDLLLTDNHLIVYGHTKGNHWNISGNHYKYFHSRESKSFVSDNVKQGEVRLKQRLLMPEFKRLSKLQSELGFFANR